MPKIITKRSDGSIKVTTDFKLKTRTQQQFKEQVNVNNIMKNYLKTGQWTHLAQKEGVYADLSKITDYKESMEKIVHAQQAFETLPASLRDRFMNSPENFIEFLQNPQNDQEAVKLGLKTKKESENVIKQPTKQPDPDPKPSDANNISNHTTT